MNRLKHYLRLMRPYQWYKNLLIYLGVIFGQHLFNIEYLLWATIGFAVLCLVSSASYVINDIKDVSQDQQHPEKKNRPLASGLITLKEAGLLALLLMVAGFGMAFFLPVNNVITEEGKILFILMIVIIFITSQAYSLALKNIVIVDVTTLSLNYVWRALSGTFLLSIQISPWLIVLSFLGALFLSLCKRKADLDILGAHAAQHKKVFQYYTADLLNQIITIVAATIIFSFSLYSFVSQTTSQHAYLVLTIPLITFIIFRYLYLLSSGSKVGRSPELLFLDKQLLISGLLLLLFFLGAIYTEFFDQLLGKFFLSLSEAYNSSFS